MAEVLTAPMALVDVVALMAALAVSLVWVAAPTVLGGVLRVALGVLDVRVYRSRVHWALLAPVVASGSAALVDRLVVLLAAAQLAPGARAAAARAVDALTTTVVDVPMGMVVAPMSALEAQAAVWPVQASA